MELSTLKLAPVADPEPTGRETSVAAPDKTAYPDLSSGAQALIEAYRLHGYCQASINPLHSYPLESPLVAELDPGAYGLAFDESASYLIHLGGAARTLTLPELLSHLRAIYCGSISLETELLVTRVVRSLEVLETFRRREFREYAQRVANSRF